MARARSQGDTTWLFTGIAPAWLHAVQSAAAVPEPPASAPGTAEGIAGIGAIIVTVAAIAVLVLIVVAVRRRRRMRLLLGTYDQPPLLVGGARHTRAHVRPHLLWHDASRAAGGAQPDAPLSHGERVGADRSTAPASGMPAAVIEPDDELLDVAAEADTRRVRRVANAGMYGAMAPAAAERLARDVPSPWPARTAAEIAAGTLQLLPGKLEVEAGDDPGQEIRFVRPHGDVAEITLGRADGPPYTHVQFRGATVSRRHARLRYEGRRWSITNLSETNPLLVNGRVVPADSGVHILRDGDRIELGEVVLRFHER
ncbi:MAG TPA: FHA domain-containing protein [Gemmatimonadaceae bacterium]|nr:FHA domain-containing protein [Gemmatimonadaceae bacterium]